MVSLLKLAEITEEGVKFESPHDGSEMLLTPEHSIHIQNAIGKCEAHTTRGATIHLCHDTIRITILTSRYDMYHDI